MTRAPARCAGESGTSVRFTSRTVMNDRLKISVEKLPSGVRVPWRVKLKSWWFHHWTLRHMSDEQKKLIEHVESRVERAFIFGKETE